MAMTPEAQQTAIAKAKATVEEKRKQILKDKLNLAMDKPQGPEVIRLYSIANLVDPYEKPEIRFRPDQITEVAHLTSWMQSQIKAKLLTKLLTIKPV